MLRHSYLPTFPSQFSRQLSCCWCQTMSPLLTAIYGLYYQLLPPYYNWSVVITISLLLIPSTHFIPYTVCLCHFQTNTVVIALHVIPLFLCLWQQPFTCSVLFCLCEELLYGCIISVCQPSLVTAVKRAIVYFIPSFVIATLSLLHLHCATSCLM